MPLSTEPTLPPLRSGALDRGSDRFSVGYGTIVVVALLLAVAFVSIAAYAPKLWFRAFMACVVVSGGLAALMWRMGSAERMMLVMLAFIAPFAIDFQIYEPDHYHIWIGFDPGLVISARDIVLFALVAVWLWQAAVRLPRDRPSPGAAGWIVAGLLVLSLASIVHSPAPSRSIVSWIHFAGRALFFFYLVRNLCDRDMLRMVCAALCVGVFVQSVVAGLQQATGHAFGLRLLGEQGGVETLYFAGGGEGTRVAGLTDHPNNLAAELSMLVPLPLALMWAWRGTQARLLLLGTILLGCAAMVFTLSRTGWLCLATGYVLVFYFSMRRRGSSRLRAVALPSGSLLAAGVVALVSSESVWKRVMTYDFSSGQSRMPMMQNALAIIGEYPLLGAGLGCYREAAMLHGVAGWSSTILLRDVHNAFLWVTAETGILSGLLLVFLIVYVLRRSYATLRHPDPFLAAAATGLWAGLVSWVLIALPNNRNVWKDTTFWMICALLLAIAHLGRNEEARAPLEGEA